jgi:hypothetical protein
MSTRHRRHMSRALQLSAAGSERPQPGGHAQQPEVAARRTTVRCALQPAAADADNREQDGGWQQPAAANAEGRRMVSRALQPSAVGRERPNAAWCSWARMIGLLVCMLCAASAASQAKPIELRTLAEQTKFVRTGRYAEVEQLCAAFVRAYPKHTRCFEFGRTPEGRPMLALAASADGKLDPAAVKAAGRPVVLAQGGIHAGEIDGKDAGFLALRELLEGRAAPGVLQQLTFVFVPVFNVDGHERFGAWNRPNQVGPEQMGWRTTAQNLNLNRDYAKADAPEMQAMLRLLGEWDPLVYVDLHVTDGAKFEHDIALMVAPTLAGDPELMRSGAQLRDRLLHKLREQGSLPLDFYPAFVRSEDPSSGFAAIVSAPRFSQQYWALHNRLGLLVETHSWKDYRTRVRITRNALVETLAASGQNAQAWLATAKAADQRAAQLAGSPVPLRYENDGHTVTIDFRGYAYTRQPSAISGGLITRYDDTKPQLWRVPLYDRVKVAQEAQAPRGGYIVPAAHAAWVRAKLELHGIQAHAIAERRAAFATRTFRATKVTVAPGTNEGHSTFTLEGSWKPEKRDIPAGSLYVPIAQPSAALAMALLEPQAPDSLAGWGFFSTAFERKEDMEDYVADGVATALLKKSPELAREFNQKLETDPDFAKNPQARLDFFYRAHPSWDEAHNLYPIMQTDTAP